VHFLERVTYVYLDNGSSHTAVAFPALCYDSWSVRLSCLLAPSSLTYGSSKITPSTHILNLGFLKRPLGVKKGIDINCVLRETGQMPIFFYWFGCIIPTWNSLHSFKQSSSFLRKLCGLTFLQTEVKQGLVNPL
jgi:hypothetical protein